MIDWQKIKHFKKEEFTCKCGCGLNNISDELVLALDIARKNSNFPFIINSACRCETHNKKIGGVKDSAHVKGLAVDISIPDDTVRFIIVSALLNVGFKRVLMYDTFIHVDVDLTKPQFILKIMK
ncbi:MAG: peptidase M15 [Campylobacterales bacterium]|nr:peptidase M15 [Campylobacterales bacterium]MBN2832572.1 peptidase M15 [Campylobacterales bacterium]